MRGNSVALVERGLRGVSMETLNAIADTLDVPAACLTILGTSKIAGNDDSKALVKSMQKLIVATVVWRKQKWKPTRDRKGPRRNG